MIVLMNHAQFQWFLTSLPCGQYCVCTNAQVFSAAMCYWYVGVVRVNEASRILNNHIGLLPSSKKIVQHIVVFAQICEFFLGNFEIAAHVASVLNTAVRYVLLVLRGSTEVQW
jgi:hypothetical protein